MPVYLSPGVYVEEVASAIQAIAGVSTSTAGFVGVFPDTVTAIEANPEYDPTITAVKTSKAPEPIVSVKDDKGKAAEETSVLPPAADTGTPANLPYRNKTITIAAPAGEVRLCTSFSEFRSYFGDFSTHRAHNLFVHAAYGYYKNGGSRLFCVRITSGGDMDSALQKFEAVDEIAIVATPGLTDATTRSSVLTHCDTMGNRFAVLDTPDGARPEDPSSMPPTSKNGAVYTPWLEVADPVKKLQDPKGTGTIFVPPSGHVAGVYARVDTERGVHKAPANEVVRGAVGLKVAITKAQQAGLNPLGMNCIRDMNGNIRIWGARTIGGDRNGEWRYVNVRRLFLFLQKSIDHGTQWVVFEPNDLLLWGRIVRNVSAFLTSVWRDGALFGATAAEAFYVKCDRETNPPDLRELGQVVTEIGVAIVRPAEFVIFRISQWQPESK